MSSLLMLIPVALMLGLLGLLAFLWALKSGQFDDLDGAAHRILFDDDDEMMGKPEATPSPQTSAPDSDAVPSAAPSGQPSGIDSAGSARTTGGPS